MCRVLEQDQVIQAQVVQPKVDGLAQVVLHLCELLPGQVEEQVRRDRQAEGMSQIDDLAEDRRRAESQPAQLRSQLSENDWMPMLIR